MKQGFFPGQQRVLQQYARIGLDAADDYRRLRRRFLAWTAGCVLAAGTGGFWLGWRSGSAATPAIEPGEVRRHFADRLPWARAYAKQPTEVLVRNHSSFLLVIEHTGGDEETWWGFAKLAEFALAGGSPQQMALRRRLRRVLTMAPPPASLRALAQRLGEDEAR